MYHLHAPTCSHVEQGKIDRSSLFMAETLSLSSGSSSQESYLAQEFHAMYVPDIQSALPCADDQLARSLHDLLRAHSSHSALVSAACCNADNVRHSASKGIVLQARALDELQHSS